MFFKNSVIKPITVEFVGEEAIDDGGPLRELYTIFYDNAPGKLLYIKLLIHVGYTQK